MASEITRDPLRGLLIADERGEIWDAQSSYTEAGPRAGVPAPAGVSHMVLTAWGEQTAGTTLEVQTMRAGVARSDPAKAAAYVYRSGTTGDWYGWNAPSLTNRFETLQHVNTGTPTDETYARNPDAIALPDGTVLVVYEAKDTSVAASYQVRLQTRNVDTGAWSEATIYSTSFEIPTDQHYAPCILRLPSGRLLVYHWVFDPVLTEANVRVHASDDDGATWAVVQQYALDTPVPYGPETAWANGNDEYQTGRLRAAYSLGQVLVMAAVTYSDSAKTYRSRLIQWGSLDLGLTLEQVEIWDGDNEAPAGIDIIDTPSGFLIAYAAGQDAAGGSANAPLNIIQVGSAFEATEGQGVAITGPGFQLSAGITTLETSATVNTSPGVVLTRDGDSIYLHYVARVAGGVGFGAALYTTDHGSTWAGLYGLSGTLAAAYWHYATVADKVPFRLAGCISRGTTFIASNYLGQTATQDSLVCHYLGGYSSLTMPGIARWLEPGRRASHAHSWLPYDLPGTMGWTAAGIGTQTLNQGYLTVSTTGVQVRTYTHAPTTTLQDGLLIMLSVQQVTGGGVGSAQISLIVRVDDGSNGYQVQVNIGSSAYRVLDSVASAQVGSDQAVDFNTTGVDLLIAIGNDAASPGNDGKVRTWHRVRAPQTEQSWTAGVVSSTLQDGGGTANNIQWGARAAGTTEARWFTFQYAQGGRTGRNLYDGQTNPDDLHPHPYSAIYGTQIDEGVTLRGEAGPTVRGDKWTVATRHDYPIERLLPAARQLSPRWSWRAANTAANQIAIRISDQGDTSLGSDVIGIAGFGANVPRIQIHGYDLGTTSWVLLKAVDLYSGLTGLRWTRAGTAVQVDTGGSSTTSPYLYHEECAGWTFAFSDTVARRIAHNAEGKWTNAAQRRPVLQLSDVDGTEGTSGTGGYLIPSDWVVLVDLQGATYSGIRITIPAGGASGVPNPAESYWEIGTLVVGPVVVHGDEIGWGRTLDVESGTEITEARDGTRRAHEVAPPRRIYEYGWAYGLDTGQGAAEGGASINPAGDPDPDYLEASAESGALPIASRRGTPWQVEGLIRRLAGGQQPIVYLPRIARFAEGDDALVYNRRHQLALCRLTSDVAIETVQGDELENEVVRIANLRLEEEV